MKCDQMPEQLISLLYNDLDSKQQRAVQKHLENCDKCRQSFQELQETTHMLEKWEPDDPRFHHVFITQRTSRWRSIKDWIAGFGFGQKLAIGASAACVSLLLMLALFDFKADFENGNWHISFGLTQSEGRDTQAEMTKLMDSRHEETLAAVAEMIRESRDQQDVEYDRKLTLLMENFEQKRRQDLMMVGQGLEGLHLSNEGRYYETRSILNNLIKMASMENPQ